MKSMLILLTLAIVALTNAQIQPRGEICYDGYGCYINTAPFWDLFVRPIAVLPQSPDKIATKFVLHTRKNLNNGIQITAQAPSTFFMSNKQTRFIVHGFIDTIRKQWIIDMKDALLRVEDSNVILVDWSSGNSFPYTQATANTQIVGTAIAILINSYVSKGLITPDHVHIIGHSLGSHIAGYAGERITPKIARITGLDPAGPYFENADIRVRLDPSDAKFVDAIHTDGSATLQIGLGLMQSVGHLDFYPNGGKDQPNCPATSGKLLGAIFNLIPFDMTAIEEVVACSHMAACHFYTNSIEASGDCNYNAYPCSNLDNFRNGKCISCTARGCNRMGHWASPTNDLGTLYFTTQDATSLPYCYSHYKLKATSAQYSGQKSTKGKVSVVVRGTKRQSTEFVTDGASLTAGAAIEFIGESAGDIGEILSARVTYTKSSCFLITCIGLEDKWSFASIDIVVGQTQAVAKLCSTQGLANSGDGVEFVRC